MKLRRKQVWLDLGGNHLTVIGLNNEEVSFQAKASGALNMLLKSHVYECFKFVSHGDEVMQQTPVELSNPNQPINGTLHQQGDCSIKQGGLTKREHFAGLAPEVPYWYESKLTCELIDNETHADEVELAKNIYFSWRTYYADNLLKELDK